MSEEQSPHADPTADPGRQSADLAIDFSPPGAPREADAPTEPGAETENEDADFERADFGGGAPGCASCETKLDGSYYSVNSATVCVSCGKQITEHQKVGTMPAGLIRAIAFGAVPAAVGGLIWWALLKYAHFELALIAIAIGFCVGGAVRMASGGRGGIAFQVIAVALTYFSVTGAYVPLMIGDATSPTYNSIMSGLTPEAQNHVRALVADGQVPPLVDGMTKEQGMAIAFNAEVSQETLDGLSPVPDDAERARVLEAIGPYEAVPLGEAVAHAVPYALKEPFRGEGGSMLLGLLILGFGLWQAFKMNAHTPLSVSGPHELGEPASQT